jgi:hypothetical protein
MLACREDHPAEWSRICEVASIDSDSAREMAFGRDTRRLAIAAVVISLVTFGWQIVQDLLLDG